MKEVTIYARGSVSPEHGGRYLATLNFKGAEKWVSGRSEDENTTAQRMMITGIIEAVKLLKEPCKLTIYAHDRFRLKKIQKARNPDLIQAFLDAIAAGGHEFDFILSVDRQETLARRLHRLLDPPDSSEENLE